MHTFIYVKHFYETKNVSAKHFSTFCEEKQMVVLNQSYIITRGGGWVCVCECVCVCVCELLHHHYYTCTIKPKISDFGYINNYLW